MEKMKVKSFLIFVLTILLNNLVRSGEVPLRSATQSDQELKNIKFIESKILPDISAILNLHENGNEEKLKKLQAFISTGWPLLETNGYKVKKDTPFTLIIPKFNINSVEKARLKDFILEHIVPGKAYHNKHDESYGNSNKHKLTFRESHGKWDLNGIGVIETMKVTENMVIIFIDGVLDRKAPYSKRNIVSHTEYNEPQRSDDRNHSSKYIMDPLPKESKHSPLVNFLSTMKTGTKVFQHFLLKSNLTQIMDDGPFTILIPADNAFQRWHPIDWGFYPFSVPEFTESILRNHFIQSQNPIRMNDVKNTNKLPMKTLGGEMVIFRNAPFPNVNNVSILADYTLSNGNQVFIISEVLFVSEAVVSKLHQMHKDKETPPLLAFPWFGAQFLSHSFLALERDARFIQITRFLNNAEIAPYISGANYTFFVPEDQAFRNLGFDRLSDEIFSSPQGVKLLLHHFVRGRLYDRDLKDNEVFETIGGGIIKITRTFEGTVSVNTAKIVESEVFVYNLGTMFYIDSILYPDILQDYISKKNSGHELAGRPPLLPTPSDVEIVPKEFYVTEPSDSEDDEIITPKALPVRFMYNPK